MTAVNKILNIECLEYLKTVPNSFFDAIIQDPPYNTTQNNWEYDLDLVSLWAQWERVAKPAAPIIFTAAQPFATDLIVSNRKLFKYDLIWYKPLGTGHLNAKKMPMRNHEHILVFYNKPPVYNPQMGIGKRKFGMRNNKRNGGCYGNFAKDGSEIESFDDEGQRYPQSVLEITNGDRTKEQFHPTQKPIDLMRYLIRTYTNIGDIVFDGYSGSGTTAAAAMLEDRKFVCCENDTENGYFEYSLDRIDKIKNTPTLFI